MSNDEKVELLRRICTELQAEGRYDLMLQGIGGVNLERLCVEAARDSLSVLSGSNRLWFERKKTIELPRELVVFG